MAKYEVMKPWYGVKVGQVFEADQLHPALSSHVREAPSQTDGELTPATPETGTAKRGRQTKAENE